MLYTLFFIGTTNQLAKVSSEAFPPLSFYSWAMHSSPSCSFISSVHSSHIERLIGHMFPQGFGFFHSGAALRKPPILALCALAKPRTACPTLVAFAVLLQAPRLLTMTTSGVLNIGCSSLQDTFSLLWNENSCLPESRKSRSLARKQLGSVPESPA